jgi:serine/threonine-protein kinase
MVAPPPPPTSGSYPVAQAPPPPRRTWPWVVVLVLLAAIAGLAAYLFLNTNGNNQTAATATTATTAAQVALPSVIDFPAAAAVTQLTTAGYKVTQVHRFSKKPKDTVIAQDPAAGTLVAPNSDVQLTISDGVEQVQVKDVVGKQVDSAATILKGDGFKVVQKGKSSDTVPQGQVISQDPIAGTTTDKGSPVTLTVSRGVAQVTVPNVINLSEGEARRQIEGAGFQVAVDNAPSSTIASGTVISQDPAANKKADKGALVTIVVSSGPPQAQIPPVAGKPENDARTALEDLGFTVTTQDVPVTDPAQDGVVQSTNPPAGQKAAQGSTVTMAVGRLTP